MHGSEIHSSTSENIKIEIKKLKILIGEDNIDHSQVKQKKEKDSVASGNKKDGR